MPSLQDVRSQYPQYADMSDEQLAQKLHAKFYADMSYADFAAKAGIKPAIGGEHYASPINPLPSGVPQMNSVESDAEGKPLYADFFNGPQWAQAFKNVGQVGAQAISGTGALASGLWAKYNPLGPADPAQAQALKDAIQQRYTYQPTDQSGRDLSRVAGYIPGKIREGAVALGGETAGDITDVGMFALPALRGVKLPAVRGLISEAAPAGFGAAVPIPGEAATRAAQMEAKGANVARQLQGRPTVPVDTVAAATERAKEYVRSRTRLDWNTLSDSVKSRLVDVAKDATALNGLDALAVERQALLQSLPQKVPATHGQLTRNSAELRNEGNVSATNVGQPIRDIHIAQNEALLQNLDTLKGRVSGTGKTAATATTPEQVGTSVQDIALRNRAKASQKNYQGLYDIARKTEPGAAVPADPLYKMLESNPEVQHLGFVDSWLKRGKVEKTNTTDGETVAERRQVTLNELVDLRQKANDISRTGGTDGYYAGKVRDAIDQSMASVPEAAAAWKRANQAFKEHKIQFEDQTAVRDLVENKTRTDRTIALEDTVKHIRTGSLADIEAIKRSLLTGGSPLERMQGRKAIRDIRAQVIQDIKDQATKSIAADEKGNANLTPAALKRAIDGYGKAKLDSIFGPGTTAQLSKILEAAKIVKTEPPTQIRGSSTVANALTLLERNIGKIPFVGPIVGGAVKAGVKLHEMGTNARVAEAATQSPITIRPNTFAQYAKQQNRLRNSRRVYSINALASQTDSQARRQAIAAALTNQQQP